MPSLDRRRFLQTSSALVGGLWTGSLFAAESPKFAASPSFDPQALFLTWQRDPTTTMTVQWIGSEAEGKQRPVWFSKAGSMDWRTTAGTSRRYPKTDQYVHRTELTGLEPGTDYVFRVGLDSAERGFRTMPAKATDTIHFVSGGDSGVSEAAKATNALAAKQAPMFCFMGGDLAYENGRDADTFLTFLKNYARQMIDDKQRLIPMLACIGNHEVDGSYGQPREKAPFYYSVFDGLYKETGYASLDFGDYLSLVLLDTNHTTPVAGEQTSWLEKTLKEREELPNVFVFNHVPSYPSYRPFVGKDGDQDSGVGADSRKHWTPLFERYNVDAVFEHHDHTYKRTHALRDGMRDERGIVYLGDGSWGKLRRPKTPEERPYLAKVDEAYHLSVHRIEGEERFHVALSDSGRVVDVCTTTKRGHAR
jgi:hypothetical protein